MRDLTPTAETDLDAAYAHPDGPWLRANMVTSLDGAATIGGRVGALTGPEDQMLLHLLRVHADVTLVGAGTIRGEGYGPLTVTKDEAEARVARGQTPQPGLAIVTNTAHLDPASTLFTEASIKPIIVTCAASDQQRRAELEPLADIVVVGDGHVDLARAVGALHDRGLTRVLTEGGPHLLGELFGADLVDELCMALCPKIVGGGIPLTTSTAPLRTMRLHSARTGEDFLFLQYRRS